MSYIAKVQSHEYKYPKGVQTKSGAWFWVVYTNEGGGWITSKNVKGDELPHDLEVWKTRKEAEEFLKEWDGHPYWCVPNGIYEILEVRPCMVEVQNGWEIVVQEEHNIRIDTP